MVKKMNNNINQIQMKNIESYYDIFDKACMLLVEKVNTRTNYLEAFIRFAKDIDNGYINSQGLENKDIKKLESLMNQIFDLEILNEEVRQALVLIIVKGLKHAKLSLGYVTPDMISYLFSYIISNLYKNQKVKILDLDVGCGNLINAIANELEQDNEYYGISSDEIIIQVASSFCNLCGNEASLYLNDLMDKSLNVYSNICISDKNLSYDAILKYNELSEYMLLLIDNDFFSKEESNKFKKEFNGTMLGLIVLPNDLFKQNIGKSILLLTSKEISNYDMAVFNLPSFRESDKLRSVLNKLSNWIDNIN